jgi:hypothetical protein
MQHDTRHTVRDASGLNNHAVFPAIALLGAGLVLGIRAARTLRQPPAREATGDRNALATYLRDHLSGSDAAIRIVERLRRTHAGTSDGRLFGALFVDLQHERDVVRTILSEIGASALSAKRLVASAGSALSVPMSDGAPGELALFRTLEGLAIGVHGKRLLWRALQEVEPPFAQISRGRLGELERLAIRQWEEIDARRRALARITFIRTHGT